MIEKRKRVGGERKKNNVKGLEILPENFKKWMGRDWKRGEGYDM